MPINVDLASLREPIDRSWSVDSVESRVTVHRMIRKDTLGTPQWKQVVVGIVSEPGVVDSQGDVISIGEIEKEAWFWAENHLGSLKVQHAEEGVGRLRVLESFLAPCDYVENGQQVRKGSWVMVIRVVDKALWQDVLDGKITGLSIGGVALRTPT